MDIAGRRVLVTGASRGIGRDLARGFAKEGADVALVARGAQALEELAAETGGRAYPTDLTDLRERGELIQRVEADGPIDILVNNAGDERIGAFTAMDAETLEFVIALNVTAAADLMRQVLPGMLDRGRGHIVNISSLAGVAVPPMLALYSSTKAFLTHLSMNLRFELEQTPIGVTKVEIGEVSDTGLMEKGRTSPELAGWFDRIYRARLGRVITPQEITTATLTAVQENRASVRLPRRMAPMSVLVDLPRMVVQPFARGLMPDPRRRVVDGDGTESTVELGSRG